MTQKILTGINQIIFHLLGFNKSNDTNQTKTGFSIESKINDTSFIIFIKNKINHTSQNVLQQQLVTTGN